MRLLALLFGFAVGFLAHEFTSFRVTDGFNDIVATANYIWGQR